MSSVVFPLRLTTRPIEGTPMTSASIGVLVFFSGEVTAPPTLSFLLFFSVTSSSMTTSTSVAAPLLVARLLVDLSPSPSMTPFSKDSPVLIIFMVHDAIKSADWKIERELNLASKFMTKRLRYYPRFTAGGPIIMIFLE